MSPQQWGIMLASTWQNLIVVVVVTVAAVYLFRNERRSMHGGSCCGNSCADSKETNTGKQVQIVSTDDIADQAKSLRRDRAAQDSASSRP